MAGDRELELRRSVELETGERHVHVRFPQIEENGVQRIQQLIHRLGDAELRAGRALGHPHQQTGADAVAGHVRHVPDPMTIRLDEIDQVAADLAAGIEIPQNSNGPMRRAMGGTSSRWMSRARLISVWSPHVSQPLAPNEMRQQNEADDQRGRDDRRVDAKPTLECLPDERGGWSWAQAVELRDHQNVSRRSGAETTSAGSRSRSTRRQAHRSAACSPAVARAGSSPLLTMSVRMPAGMNMKKTLARNVTYDRGGQRSPEFCPA